MYELHYSDGTKKVISDSQFLIRKGHDEARLFCLKKQFEYLQCLCNGMNEYDGIMKRRVCAEEMRKVEKEYERISMIVESYKLWKYVTEEGK